MRGKRMVLPCEVCSAVVVRYPSTLKGRVFCSQKCVASSRKHGSELFCDMCDGRFYRRFGEQDIGAREHQFCSGPCYMQWRAIGAKSYRKIGKRHEHRVVVEQHIGRALTSEEVVHHVDFDKRNNALSNLMLFPDSSTHMLCHWGRLSDAQLRSFSLV